MPRKDKYYIAAEFLHLLSAILFALILVIAVYRERYNDIWERYRFLHFAMWLTSLEIHILVMSNMYPEYKRMQHDFETKDYAEPSWGRWMFKYIYDGEEHAAKPYIKLFYAQLWIVIGHTVAYWCVEFIDPWMCPLETFISFGVLAVVSFFSMCLIVYIGFIKKFKRLTFRNLKFLLTRLMMPEWWKKEPVERKLGTYRIRRIYRRGRYVQIEEAFMKAPNRMLFVGSDLPEVGNRVSVYEICGVKYAREQQKKA